MKHLFVFLKGMAMGAADVVPGVSGGTIAFISGIYERLLNAIKSVNLDALKVLQKEGIKSFWAHIDGTFLAVLFAGILASIFTLAAVLSWTLGHYPQLLWSFFMGLVIASAVYIGRQLEFKDYKSVLALFIGIAIAYGITLFSPGEIPKNYLTAFIAGAIAICAMILPGISGSFILLLMGMYAHVLGAVKDREFMFLLVFASGCLVGLLSFSRVLSWLFKNYKATALAVLTGFMVGSLPKVWPWQNPNTNFSRINRHGETEYYIYENVMPKNFGGEPYVIVCCLLFILGFVVVFLLEWLGNKESKNEVV